MFSTTQFSVAAENSPTVYLVDDDADFSLWLSEALASIQVHIEAFRTPSAFFGRFDRNRMGCILLDVRLPEMSGLEVQKRLVCMGVLTPIVLITAYGDVSMAVEALKSGAVDFIQKPCSVQALLDRLQRAIDIGIDRHRASSQASYITARIESLSPREAETMNLLLDGKTTKEIASLLNIGLTTVDFHRKNVLDKMNVENVVTLTRLMGRYRELTALVGTE